MTEAPTEAPLVPAATLIVLRDGGDTADKGAAPAELLMLRRAATMAFAAGAWVFPGGRVDDADRLLAATLTTAVDTDIDDSAARIAAIRETIEEAGLAVGLDPAPDAATLAAIRAGLHAGQPLGGLLETAGCAIDLAALMPFARWVPPGTARRRFDTRFYLARAPHDTTVAADGGESVAICWATAAAMLARDDATIIFPTRCNLRRMAQYAGFDDAAAATLAFPPGIVALDVENIDGRRHLCVREGQGYPVIREPIDTLVRG